MSDYDKEINSALDGILGKNYAEAQNGLNNILDAKLADRLDQEREAIATEVYGGEEVDSEAE